MFDGFVVLFFCKNAMVAGVFLQEGRLGLTQNTGMLQYNFVCIADVNTVSGGSSADF